MKGLIIDSNDKIGMIESSYFSQQILQRIYKVRYFVEDKKLNLNHYKFIQEDEIRETKLIESNINWNSCKMSYTLDKCYQFTVLYNEQVITAKSNTEISAFDLLCDTIMKLKGV